LPENIVKRLAKAYRASTNKQWEYAWKSFVEWLKNEQADINETAVLRYLEHLFLKGLSPRTILTHRGALALPLKWGFNISVTDIKFKLLARAHFLERPPTIRIMPSWDLKPVLELLMSRRFTFELCSEKDLLTKTLFLVALSSARRASELAALHRPSVLFRRADSEVVLAVKPSFLYKNQREDNIPPPICIKAFKVDRVHHALCPVRSLRLYLNKTENKAKGTSVFVSAFSGSPLNRASISLKLCILIKEACPDAMPKAHDMRKQAVSLAWTRGIPPAEIIKAAFWKSANTFISRYLCPHTVADTPFERRGGGRA
jgi:hypothetical protein